MGHFYFVGFLAFVGALAVPTYLLNEKWLAPWQAKTLALILGWALFEQLGQLDNLMNIPLCE